jgi:uncharacterized protein (DUF58 family)
MRFRRQTTICREGWYYLAIIVLVFGGAIFKDVNLLLVLAGMLLGAFLVNWRAVRTTLAGLRIERQLPSRISAGDVLSVNLSLLNTRRRLGSWAIVAEEQIEREAAAADNNHGRPRAYFNFYAKGDSPIFADTKIGTVPQPTLRPSVLFPYVEAGQSRRGTYRGRLTQRGRYRFGPLRLSTRFPFGLFSRTIDAGQAETLVVLPRLGRLTEGWTSRRLEAFAGTQRRQRPGVEGDFYGVREWRGGDGRRLIHWRSSARLGRLVVRQFERPRTRDVAVVLDLWQPENSAAEHAENVELAVSFAATVLADVCRKSGSNVYLGLSNTGPECAGGPASPATLQGLMERLAVAEARTEGALPALLSYALPRIPADTEIVLVSTRGVDLAAPARFAALWSDPLLRERARRISCVDTSSARLSDFFEVV